MKSVNCLSHNNFPLKESSFQLALSVTRSLSSVHTSLLPLSPILSEAFEPDAGSPVESESVRLDSSLGEGEVESMRAESSLGGGEEWAGSDISVGEVEDGEPAVLYSNKRATELRAPEPLSSIKRSSVIEAHCSFVRVCMPPG